MANKNIYERYFDDLLTENFLLVAPFVIIIYPMMGIIDSHLAQGNVLFFFLVRFAFIIPVIISYIIIKKNILHIPVIYHIYSQFIFPSIGVCLISYYLGGLTSDYYFGLIIVSFLQFTFLPIKAKNALILDIFYYITFYALNFLPFDHDISLFFKQSSNFITFIFFKYISSKRSENLIFGSMHRYSLDKDLNDNEEAAQLFGELCHLISNPLFISQSLVKKASVKTTDPELESMLNKSLWAHERITAVVKKMLEFNRTKKSLKTYRKDLINHDENPEIPHSLTKKR